MAGTRHHERVQVSLPATVKTRGGTFRDVITNVSLSGIHLQADHGSLRPGDRVRVAFSLTVAGHLVPLEVEGSVARVERNAAKRVKGVGVRLTRPSPRVVQTIEGYLAQLDPGRGTHPGTEGDDPS